MRKEKSLPLWMAINLVLNQPQISLRSYIMDYFFEAIPWDYSSLYKFTIISTSRKISNHIDVATFANMKRCKASHLNVPSIHIDVDHTSCVQSVYLLYGIRQANRKYQRIKSLYTEGLNVRSVHSILENPNFWQCGFAIENLNYYFNN